MGSGFVRRVFLLALLLAAGSAGAVRAEKAAWKEPAAALEKGFGVKPVFIREGGSIPITQTFQEILGADSLLLGWGQDDDRIHSPNEKFDLGDFHRGALASAYLIGLLGEE